MLLVAFLYYLPAVMKDSVFMKGHFTSFRDDIATRGVNGEQELARHYCQGIFSQVLVTGYLLAE